MQCIKKTHWHPIVFENYEIKKNNRDNFLLSLFFVIISVVQPISEQGCVANIEYELDVSKHTTTILLSNIVSCNKTPV